jgi:hypothetical protein
MRNVTVRMIWVLAFLLTGVAAGCGREQAPVVVPAVVATSPASGATGVALNATVSATFNLAMAPATINATTFTVTGPGAAVVLGTVTYAGVTATFTPTTSLTADSVYTATITTGAQSPTGQALAANYVWSFTTGAPTVISNVPLTGATAVPINTLVSATFSEAMDPATINGTTFTLTGPGATPVAGVVTYAGTTATFTPGAALATSTLYTATITTGAKDPAGAALAANFAWTFTTAAPPTVTSTVPAAGATAVAVNTLVSATFSEAMNPATINGTTFTLTGPGVTPVAGVVTYAGTTATFTPTTPLAGTTLFTATITTGAKDPTGAPLAANYVWTFTTASQPPAVTSTNPANAATNVPVNQKITATFNEPMSAGTIIASGTFTVVATTGGAPVTGVVTYNAASNTAIFTPSADLAPSTEFTGMITTAAQNSAGQALPADYVWNFTTGTLASATAPTVVLTNPVSAATGVPLNQKVVATFSEPMDPATISATGTFTVVTTVGAVPVPGTVAYDAPSNTAIFTPTANLAASTEYTATISNAAKDLEGNALIAGSVPNPWNFTTGTTLDTTAPTITLTNPVSGATAVPIDTTVNATFSAAMNPTTITNQTFLVTVTATGTSVSGTVAYDPASQIATFTPSANLEASTQYTATILPAVQDLYGNALAPGVVPNPWNFTTGTAAGGAYPATVNLGTAGNFAVLATASITSTGPVIVNGDVGVGPGTSDGIPTDQVNGTIYGPGSVVTKAQADLLAAYNDAVGRSANSIAMPGDIGGLTLTPGLYTNSTSVLISTNVTLNAQGNPNAVFIFQMGTTLTTAGSVILTGGAKASNIFWVVGSSATLNGPIFQGNILADVSITQNGGVVVNGRLFAGSGPGGAGSVIVDGVSVNIPQQ